MNPHRIIMIEDNPADTQLLRRALDECGEPYTLEVLPDGERALRFIRDYGCRPEPCLFILDLHLPRYDGAVILRAIKSDPELAHVAVAVVTSMASPWEELEVKKLGVELYRTKPMNWEDTVALAHGLMDLCRRAGRSPAPA